MSLEKIEKKTRLSEVGDNSSTHSNTSNTTNNSQIRNDPSLQFNIQHSLSAHPPPPHLGLTASEDEFLYKGPLLDRRESAFISPSPLYVDDDDDDEFDFSFDIENPYPVETSPFTGDLVNGHPMSSYNVWC